MLQLFRSFQWASIVILIGIALALRGAPLLLGLMDRAAGIVTDVEATGTWGEWLSSNLAGLPVLGYVLGAVVVCLIGFVGAAALQEYRLSAAGTLPALVAIALGSAQVAWTGFAPELLAALALAAAGYQLFDAYRHQGEALPVFNTGLWIGVAWLCATGFAWFGVWGLVALVQLRRVRGGELLGYLLALLALPALVGIYRYTRNGELTGYWEQLFGGLLRWPDLESLEVSLWPLLILAIPSAITVVGYGSLTTRRPVQEQRANRMWYSMLAVGWAAILVGGYAGGWAVAYVLAPLSVLLGVWLAERSHKFSDGVALAGVLLILASYGYLASVG